MARGGGKSKKVPSGTVQGQFSSKTVRRIIDPEDFRTANPAWQVHRMDWGGPFGWNAAASEDVLRRILDRLKSWETMQWSEFFGPSKDCHSIPLSDLIKEAKDRLDELKLSDLEALDSLRIGGKERVWGIRDGRALRLLWWDPDHQICPSHKKNT